MGAFAEDTWRTKEGTGVTAVIINTGCPLAIGELIVFEASAAEAWAQSLVAYFVTPLVEVRAESGAESTAESGT